MTPARTVWSLATTRTYLRLQTRASALGGGAGRQAGVGLAAGVEDPVVIVHAGKVTPFSPLARVIAS